LVGYLARHSTNAFEALEGFARFARLIGDSAACRVEVSSGLVELRFGLSGGRSPLPEAVDYFAVLFCRGIGVITAEKARLLCAHLERPRPPKVEPYRKALCGAVSFGADETALVFAEAELRVPYRKRDPRLRAILEESAEQVLAGLPDGATFPE